MSAWMGDELSGEYNWWIHDVQWSPLPSPFLIYKHFFIKINESLFYGNSIFLFWHLFEKNWIVSYILDNMLEAGNEMLKNDFLKEVNEIILPQILSNPISFFPYLLSSHYKSESVKSLNSINIYWLILNS
jgi:hypothetical protein